jgi:hypothetical protein
MDVGQAYLQAASNLKRDVFIHPDELELAQDELLKVVKPRYGLSDSGDYWAETLVHHHIWALRMSQETAIVLLFFGTVAGELAGISSTRADDLLQAGAYALRQDFIKKAITEFDVKDPEELPFSFTRIEIRRKEGCEITTKQRKYNMSMSQLALDTSWALHRSER